MAADFSEWDGFRFDLLRDRADPVMMQVSAVARFFETAPPPFCACPKRALVSCWFRIVIREDWVRRSYERRR